MTPDELVGRLQRVSKTPTGWMARCPAHEDDRPSLSVGIGQDRRILLRCFAGCEVEEIVAALNIEKADLFPPDRAAESAAGGDAGVVPAARLQPVRAWLRDVRKLPDSEISHILAAETRGGHAVVFRYRDETGRTLYEKYRPLGTRKTFWRVPTGRPSVLYGLDRLNVEDTSGVIVVEGELDLHALRAVGIGQVISVPDGAGSRISSDLLRPLRPFRTVLLAVDGDDPGEDLAVRLARELGRERCRRVFFQDGSDTFKDANDALKGGWTREMFEAVFARAAARIPTGAAPSEDTVLVQPSGDGEVAGQYRVVDGQLCRTRHDREGNESVQVLANFDVRIVEEIACDDGVEVVHAFRLQGKLPGNRPLPEVRISAADFGTMNWVPRAWGARGYVQAGQGARDHLRVAVHALSRPNSRHVFRHTGWRLHNGRWVYLYQGGAIGAPDLAVELDPPLNRFTLPPKADNLREAVGWSLRLLDCAPVSVAIPLLAGIYMAPLSFVTSPDYALWLVGPSGSLKSELAALAQRHFGTFDRKTLPGSWTSTENSLEGRLFTVKDALIVVDDYAPAADSRAQQELERRAQRIIRGIGNRASRGRLRPDLTQQPDRPPRGLVLCTGEDLPPGHSIQARLVILEVDRARLDLEVVSALQANGDRLVHAMRGYLEWLAPSVASLQTTIGPRLQQLRSDLQSVGSHLRQADALAQLCYAFDLLMEFAVEVGAIDAVKGDQLRLTARTTLRGIGEAQGSVLKDLEPAERFVTVLRTLLDQRRVRLVERGNTPGSDEIEAIGWYDLQFAYLLPEAARRRVATFMRDAGEAWGFTAHALHKALVRKKYVEPGTDGRPEVQVRVGDGKRRVLRVPIEILRDVPPVPEFRTRADPSSDEPEDDGQRSFLPED